MFAAIVRNNHLDIADVADPVPGLNEAIVRVAASSINQGEVRAIRATPHWQLSHIEDGGWRPEAVTAVQGMDA